MPKPKKSLKISKNKFKRKEVSTPRIMDDSGNVRPLDAVCRFENNDATTNRSFDLNPFYNKGFDDVVNRVYYTIQSLLERSTKGGIRQSSIHSYLRNGFSRFAEFLQLWSISSCRSISIIDINKDVIDNFILHLRSLKISYTSQKACYTHLKALLKAIASNGYWSKLSAQQINEIFPRNPYPNSNKRSKGENPLRSYEKRQLIIALKKEIKPLYQKKEPLTAYELTVCVLSIAMQTGINAYSGAIQPPIPGLSGHPFRFKPDTISGINQPFFALTPESVSG